MPIRVYSLIIIVLLVVSVGVVVAQQPVDFDMLKWHDSFCYGEEVCLVGNFNGVGGDDIVAFVRGSNGNVWVALSQGNAFVQERVWHDSFCFGDEVCGVGDFNGDGRDDIIAFVRSTKGNDGDGDVWVALSDGQTFVDARVWHQDFCFGLEACLIGDFNGDGRDDIAAATGPAGNGSGDVWVAVSNGSAFVDAEVWGSISGCVPNGASYTCMAGNFDGEQGDDIVSYDRGSRRAWVIASMGNRFAAEERWLNTLRGSPNGDYPYFCNLPGQTCAVGDYNADGWDDIFTFAHNTLPDRPDAVFINHSHGEPERIDPLDTPTGFEWTFVAQDAFCLDGTVCHVADVNNDGFADVVVFYRSLFPDDTLAGDVFVALNRWNR